MRRLVTILIAAAICAANAMAQKQVHILSANDMHANIQAMPRLAAIVDSLRCRHPSLLVLSAGDNRTGDPLNDMYKIPAYPMVALMNQIGFTATTLGNHEFDSGGQMLGRLIGLSNFSYLCCNITPVPEWGLNTRPYQIFDVNGVKVGIIGVVQLGIRGTPNAHPNNFWGLSFTPVEQSIERYMWLREQCDVVMLLSHIGYDDDVAISRKMPWLDLIVGGHSHTQLEASEAPAGVPITQNANRLEQVTHTTILLDDSNNVIGIECENISVKDFQTSNEVVQVMLDYFCNNPEFHKTIGQVVSPITNVEEFGCLMADAYRTQGRGNVGVINFGGVRTEKFPAGPFTVTDALTLDPFGNDVVEMNLTGEELRQLLLSCYKADRNRPPFTSGVVCQWRLNADKSARSLKLLDDQGKSLNLKTTYRVVTNSYVPAICNSPRKDQGRAMNYPSAQMLIDFVRHIGNIEYTGKKCILGITK